MRPGSTGLLFVLVPLLATQWIACDRSPTLSDPENGVRVGVIYPFTGPNASTGADLKAGVELATEIVNGSFDLPVPMARERGFSFANGAGLEPVYRDSRSDPDRAGAEAENLVKREGVDALLGCYSSTVTAAASEKAEILGVPFLNAASTSPILTRRGFRWFFRTTPDDEIFAENFFAFLSELLPQRGGQVSRDLVLVYENRLWGTGVAQAERKLAARHDFDIVADIPYDANAEHFGEELAVVKSHPGSILMQASYVSDAILFMRGYKAHGINPTAILAMDSGFVSPKFLETLGSDAEFVLSREVWSPDLQAGNGPVAVVNRLFRQRFGRDMTGNSARSFTATIVLADAIERAGSTRPERIRQALLATALEPNHLIMPWAGVAFDPKTGQNTLGRGIIVQVQGGRYTAVWPTELASSPVVWPMPPWSERRDDR